MFFTQLDEAAIGSDFQQKWVELQKLLERQRAKGGIIDPEVESNRFLIHINEVRLNHPHLNVSLLYFAPVFYFRVIAYLFNMAEKSEPKNCLYFRHTTNHLPILVTQAFLKVVMGGVKSKTVWIFSPCSPNGERIRSSVLSAPTGGQQISMTQLFSAIVDSQYCSFYFSDCIGWKFIPWRERGKKNTKTCPVEI